MTSSGATSFASILLPTDFSTISVQAEATALGLASKLGSSVYLLHVVEPLDALAQDDPEVADFHRKLEKRASAKMTSLAQRFQVAGLEVRWDVILGHRWSVIVQRAEELGIDLIVMGSRGAQGGSIATALGSTSHRVAFFAPCPVMLVRSPAEPKA